MQPRPPQSPRPYFEPQNPQIFDNLKKFKLFETESVKKTEEQLFLARSIEPQRKSAWNIPEESNYLSLSKSLTPFSRKKKNGLEALVVGDTRREKRSPEEVSFIQKKINNLCDLGFSKKKLLPKGLSNVLKKYGNQKLWLNSRKKFKLGTNRLQSKKKQRSAWEKPKNYNSNLKAKHDGIQINLTETQGSLARTQKKYPKKEYKLPKFKTSKNTQTIKKQKVTNFNTACTNSINTIKPPNESNFQEDKDNYLSVFRYKNAVLAKDEISSKGIIIFESGEVYFGQLDENNSANGPGILFFPFCGFVSGNFSDNRINGRAIFKEPNGSFGITTFTDGIIDDHNIKFNLTIPKKSNSSQEAKGTRSTKLTLDFRRVFDRKKGTGSFKQRSEYYSGWKSTSKQSSPLRFKVQKYVEGVEKYEMSCRSLSPTNEKGGRI